MAQHQRVAEFIRFFVDVFQDHGSLIPVRALQHFLRQRVQEGVLTPADDDGHRFAVRLRGILLQYRTALLCLLRLLPQLGNGELLPFRLGLGLQEALLQFGEPPALGFKCLLGFAASCCCSKNRIP